jgi:predicted metal-dependent phosphotriesterase family hydrolase
MTEVMTVLGPVDAADLGRTLPHEHLFLDIVQEYRGAGLLNDPVLMAEELEHLRAAGGRTLVDCTSHGLSRNPVKVREMAQESGLNIVLGTGFYRDPYLDPSLNRMTVDEIADVIVRDLEVGMDSTDVRAGIIGETGSDREFISALEERCLRAAARAQVRTGVTITTHAARWPVGLPQLDLLVEEGADPRRVIIGHCDMVPSHEYHLEVGRRGAFIEFDTVQGESEYDIRIRVEWIMSLARAGYLDRLLLSQDVCLRSDLKALGGPGYAYVMTGFADELRTAGLTDDDVEQILVDNPRRALTGES